MGEGEFEGNLNVIENIIERWWIFFLGVVMDDDLEMLILFLGFGFLGFELEIVDDILKSDVFKFFFGNEDEFKEGLIGMIDFEMVGYIFYLWISIIIYLGCWVEWEIFGNFKLKMSDL